ncbi:MAG: hemolysin family protein [Alphaproteobacteria bacterium]
MSLTADRPVGAEDQEDPSSRRTPQPGLWQRLRQKLSRNGRNEATLAENFDDIIDDHHEIRDALSATERAMLTNILTVRETRVEDVMVPRADIVALDKDAPIMDVVTHFREAAHSRLPLYRETTDDIMGMVHIKDLLYWWEASLKGEAPGKDFSLRSIMRPVLFVPPSMPVMDLFLKMQATRIHMAIVIDEFGGTDGLATIEDLVEEIVGEILDEHESEGPVMTALSDGSFDADARVEIDDLENAIGLSLVDDDEDIDTIGGLVVALAGRVPQQGELVRHPAGIELEISAADPRRIRRVVIRRHHKSKPPAV